MNSLLGKTFAVGIAFTSAFALTPAMAGPAVYLPNGAVPDSSARVIQVQQIIGQPPQVFNGFGPIHPRYSGSYRHHRDYSGRHYRHHWNRHNYRHGRYYYRDYDNDGAGVVGGLIAGAIIGGIAANAFGNGGGGSAHVRWCYNHYRSYRASDNTYQPYNGPRRQCVSPY
jgi:hypothetical protein